MGNNEPAVDQSDLRIRGSYGLNIYIFIYLFIYIRVVRRALNLLRASFSPIFQYFIFPNLYS